MPTSTALGDVSEPASFARAVISAALQERQAAPPGMTRADLFRVLEDQVHAALDAANAGEFDAGHLVYCMAEVSVELLVWCGDLLRSDPVELWRMIAEQLTTTYSKPFPYPPGARVLG